MTGIIRVNLPAKIESERCLKRLNDEFRRVAIDNC